MENLFANCSVWPPLVMWVSQTSPRRGIFLLVVQGEDAGGIGRQFLSSFVAFGSTPCRRGFSRSIFPCRTAGAALAGPARQRSGFSCRNQPPVTLFR
jgi:hypothetical protein